MFEYSDKWKKHSSESVEAKYSHKHPSDSVIDVGVDHVDSPTYSPCSPDLSLSM